VRYGIQVVCQKLQGACLIYFRQTCRVGVSQSRRRWYPVTLAGLAAGGSATCSLPWQSSWRQFRCGSSRRRWLTQIDVSQWRATRTGTSSAARGDRSQVRQITGATTGSRMNSSKITFNEKIIGQAQWPVTRHNRDKKYTRYTNKSNAKKIINNLLANVILTFTFAICYCPSVCRLSVTLVHTTQPVEDFSHFFFAIR